MAHAFILGMWEVELRGSWVWDLPRLQGKMLFHKEGEATGERGGGREGNGRGKGEGWGERGRGGRGGNILIKITLYNNRIIIFIKIKARRIPTLVLTLF